MKPFPVVVSAAVPARVDDERAMGESLAWSIRAAGAVPPMAQTAGSTTGIGSTQNGSDQVSRVFFPSLEPAVATNEESLRIPHEARILGLNATGTRWVSSNTVSMAPLAPHTTRKSAARVTPEVTPSRSR